MTMQDTNLATIRGWNEAFNRRDLKAALACMAEDAAEEGQRLGPSGFGDRLGDVWSLFPDARIESRETVAVGDCVIDRVICSGTHLGVGAGPVFAGQMAGLPPTGRRFAVQHIHWWTLRDGLIVGHGSRRDDVTMMMQLGLLPVVPTVAQPAYLDEPPVAHRNVTGGAEQVRNIAAIRANQYAFVRRDIESVLASYAADASNHGRARGRDMMRLVFADIFRLYTPVDDDDGIVDIVAVDDCVIASFERTLRHTGVSEFPIDGGLLMGVPPTGKTFIQKHYHWWTLKDGLIVAHRACRDDIGEMLQLGLLPALAATHVPA